MVITAAPPSGADTVTRARRGSTRPARRWTGLAFVAPFLVVFVVGIVAPLAYATYLSLFREQLIGGNSFVGLGNYTAVFSDPQFYSGLRRVALFLVVQVPIMLGLALLAALAIDSGRLLGWKAARVAVFVPYAVPAVVAALMWGFMYGDEFGLVGQLSRGTGIDLPDLLAPSWMLTAIANIVTWEFVGYNMLILYASLRAIPDDLYEAAALDGAGLIRQAWSIKLPALRPALGVATLFSIIGSFQLFNEPNVLKSLAPSTITTNYTPNIYAYQLAFNGQQINYSAAVAVVLGLTTVAVAYAAQRLTAREAGR